MVLVKPGVLATSDAVTIVFLKRLNEELPANKKFIIFILDEHNLFINSDKVDFVQQQLALRLLATTFDEDDLAAEDTEVA